MALAIKVVRSATADSGVVYTWTTDDGATGRVLVDRDVEVIQPCDAVGHATGAMRVRRSAGNVENPDPVTRGNFVRVAAVIIQEWTKNGRLPQVISRTYG